MCEGKAKGMEWGLLNGWKWSRERRLFSYNGNEYEAFLIHIHIHTDMSIMTQIIKRAGEGIAATDGAGCSEKARAICIVEFR